MSTKESSFNVLGDPLENCSCDPMTGYLRDGFCNTTPDDYGTHVVCAVVTKEFLEYSLSRGNDLITPVPHWSFPGLKPGDKWCLCVSRWKEAEKAGVAPFVDLKATHELALKYVSLKLLKQNTVPSL
ncbi:DUF2237 family protein [Winogradskyella sp. UBA3174]|uniref:DUF2237 family protein n=1 Tax=Winogradskyella sp. UBA3174 TaxID=1947785 RepID=UPI0025EC49F3|nr:DUF2237 domain-containing protein [Winogradskyella sp. UBA3174]|tara:strand:- start:3803 stop:4183 length:381 start_codon:yes stop_codon:yes gene_type:complete